MKKIVLRNVHKTFESDSSKITALKNINLEISDGEFVCIVGPSGCGKTTMLNLIAGLEKPDSGAILVNGKNVGAPGPERLMVFQEPALFPWLTALENVEFGLRLKNLDKDECRKKAMHYLDMVHLKKFANSYIRELSGGMKQRVAIARALTMEPEVLLMDEPFVSLDAQTRDLLISELQAIWSKTGKTIVFVTHNVREAVRLGGRIVLLSYRPGTIKRQFLIKQKRPRKLEDPKIMKTVSKILEYLKYEVNKFVEKEIGKPCSS